MDQRIAHHRHRRRNPMGSDSSNCEPAHYSPKKKKRNCHCFRIQHCEIARSSWSGSTKQMNCILSSLLYDDTMGANISNQNLNVLAVKKCENMTVVSKHLISVLSYRHWTLVRGDLRASSISTKTMRATNACGWKSGMRSLNHSLNHVLD